LRLRRIRVGQDHAADRWRNGLVAVLRPSNTRPYLKAFRLRTDRLPEGLGGQDSRDCRPVDKLQSGGCRREGAVATGLEMITNAAGAADRRLGSRTPYGPARVAVRHPPDQFAVNLSVAVRGDAGTTGKTVTPDDVIFSSRPGRRITYRLPGYTTIVRQWRNGNAPEICDITLHFRRYGQSRVLR